MQVVCSRGYTRALYPGSRLGWAFCGLLSSLLRKWFRPSGISSWTLRTKSFSMSTLSSQGCRLNEECAWHMARAWQQWPFVLFFLREAFSHWFAALSRSCKVYGLTPAVLCSYC